MWLMRKVVVSAASGVGAALLVMTAFWLGVRVSPEVLMMAAAALSFGAAVAVLTHTLVAAPAPKTDRSKFLAKRIRDVSGLIDAFPKAGGAVQPSIRSETQADDLDVVKNPDKYRDKEIVVTLKEGGKTFNPVTLRKIFEVLKLQPNFVHLLLRSKEDEFVGYIPAHVAKKEFTGNDAEARSPSMS